MDAATLRQFEDAFDWEEFWRSRGRLQGELQAELELVEGRGRKKSSYHRFETLLYGAAKCGVMIPEQRTSRAYSVAGETPFSFTVKHIAKPRSRADIRKRDRVYFEVPKSGLSTARAFGGKTDRGSGLVYTSRSDTEILRALRRNFQEHSGPVYRTPSRNARARGTAPAHVRYIRREKAVEETVSADGEITSSILSNIGDGQADQVRLFEQLEKPKAEGGPEREDGTIQSRIIAELPYETSPEARLRIVEKFVEVFEDKRLPYVAAIHVPDNHGDARNHHVHIAYHSRPFTLEGRDYTGRQVWDWDAKKDRQTIGKPWLRLMRERFAEAVNEELERAGSDRRFHPGSYAEMGIDKERHIHLGPVLSALERQGIPTREGVSNLIAERVYEKRMAAENGVGDVEAETLRAASEAARAMRALPRVPEVLRRDFADILDALEGTSDEGENKRRNEEVRLRDLTGGLARAERLAALPEEDPLSEVGRIWLKYEGAATREAIEALHGRSRLKPTVLSERPVSASAFPVKENGKQLDAAIPVTPLEAAIPVTPLDAEIYVTPLEAAWTLAARAWETVALRNRAEATDLRRGISEAEYETRRQAIANELASVEIRIEDGRIGVIEAREAEGFSTPRAAGAAAEVELAAEDGRPVPSADPATRFLVRQIEHRKALLRQRDELLDLDENGLVFPDEEALRRRRRRAEDLENSESEAWSRMLEIVPTPERRVATEEGRSALFRQQGESAAPVRSAERQSRKRSATELKSGMDRE